jgi:predicted RNA-binding Zn ribbon-like protein
MLAFMNAMAAPGELELVRRFVNTLDVEKASDELAGPVEAASWLAGNGLLDADTTLSRPAARSVVRLREALRGALLANHDRSPIPAADLAALNEAADRAGLRVGFVPSGDWRAQPARGGADGALGRLLGTVVQAMADGTWIRLKACLNDDCRWAFYDHSNARASKWCDMRICGNRAKQKAWRTRSR